MDYNHIDIESKWKQYWKEHKIYKVHNDTSKPKYYILDMFPYPSGAGLHVGHPLGYVASDILSRFKRMQGFNVLHPMGYDSFGLPAEQYALQTGVHPADSTEKNINTYRAQLDNIGFSFDWDREVRTSDPSYYKWTQWIFKSLYEHYYDINEDKALPITNLVSAFEKSGSIGLETSNSQDQAFTAEEWNAMTPKEKDETLMNYRLAYRKTGFVNWCEALGTVLANDEIKDGVSERGGHPVERKAMQQWFLRITAYAPRLLNDLNTIAWSDALKTMQSNWIGRSEGAQVFFPIKGHDITLEIFTTRADTIFGSTFMVIAPEHDLVDQLTTLAQRPAIDACIKLVNSKSERDRLAEVKDMNGAFTGSYCINPFNGKEIPIWIGDYVLKDYGTGAIMAVPSDDERDATFAKKYDLEFIDVVDKSKYHGATLHDKLGIIINSEFLNGMEVPDAIQLMFTKIEEKGIGYKRVNFKLRDANYSRQRYWGEPIPIVYDQDGVSHAIPNEELPLLLPRLDDFKPGLDGQSPLSKAKDWLIDGTFTRETDTMPGTAGSSWYFLRYMDPDNNVSFASPEALNYWQDVDFYIGGAEHAVSHLMYSRFWHKFLYDLGKVPTKEPFKKLVNQGMIQGVIESLYLKKSEDAVSSFYTESIALKSTNESFAYIPVHVDFVTAYGTSKSHLNKEGIKKFLAWRLEYKNVQFVLENGIYTLDSFPDNGELTTKSEVGKMSKRYFNVVNPDDVVEKYGADCFRMYEMFLGPIEQSKPWDINGIDGVSKFLRKYWNLSHVDGIFVTSDEKATAEELKILHTTIKKVRDDIERFSMNTSVSAFMVCINELKRLECNKKEILIPLNSLLAPFAPFITEELHAKLGGQGSIHHASYPSLIEEHLKEDSILYPICINGKKKDEVKVSVDMVQRDIEQLVLGMDSIKRWLISPPKKVILVPGRMINIVI
jgi:leucyl-tRNA synthetase